MGSMKWTDPAIHWQLPESGRFDEHVEDTHWNLIQGLKERKKFEHPLFAVSADDL
jgi:hypothetical protein